MEYTFDCFCKGDTVNVKRLDGDVFENSFTGICIRTPDGKRITVRDKNGNCWDCEPSQLSFSSDNYIHQ